MRLSALTVVTALGLVFGVACNQPTTDADPEQPDSPSDHQDSDDRRAECQTDVDCDGYLRCIDRECRTPPAMTGERDETTPVAQFFDGDDAVAHFYLELALTSDEQATGLMYRPEMLDNWGMLFVYEEERHLSFWMKNTLIPLDMIFVDDAGEVVGIVEEAEPETLTSRSVGKPARYVLEINGGLAEQQGIEPGMEMRLHHVEDRHQPRQ